MSKSPAFRFYPSDFMGSPDVQAMDLHEVGAYTFLLSTAWLSERHGYLPDDEERIRRWSRMTREQWAESRVLLLAKFPVVEEGWRANPRLVIEAEKQAAFSESQSAKGKLGGRPKKAGEKPGLSQENPGLSSGKAGEKPPTSQATGLDAYKAEEKAGAFEIEAGASKTKAGEKPSVSASAFGISSSNEEESKGADAHAPARKRTTTGHQNKPDGPATAEELIGTGLEPEDFSAYMAVRRKKRWSFIDTATRERWIAKFRNFYAEGKDTRGMLHQMIEGRWQGVVAEKWKQRPQELVACDDPAVVWPELYGDGRLQ